MQKRYVLLAALLAACDASQPLKVKDPDVAPPGELDSPSSLPFLSAGALTDFAVSFIGASDQSNNAHEGIAAMGGVFTDEFTDLDTYTTRNELNQRVALPANGNLAAVFQNLGQTHNDARRALAAYAKFSPNDVGRAEMYAIDAYVYLLVAEHWCSGEPFSTIDVSTGAVTNSPFLSTAQMLDTALAEFQQAKIVAASDKAATADRVASVTGLAQVGAARALLDLGQVAGAADSAAAVAPAFAYQVFASSNTPRQNNGIWFYTVAFQAFSVGDRKNGTGLPFQSDTDPRVPWLAPPGEVGSNLQGPFIIQQKYASSSTPANLADYTEAQLIVAEGDIDAGNYPAALSIMNGLRAGSGLAFPARLALGDSSAAPLKHQLLQLLSERAFWLYLTGHRLGDWRRMLRAPYNTAPYGFVTSDVYPVGGSLSTTLEFPTPQLTSPNPDFKACDPTIP
ncbi:MAG TPA: hypothetical protein VFA43_17830 [Gemmatimonadaceae bacterium]|nr:hypothetical protein [Gemmatimonadaceae bacterium]